MKYGRRATEEETTPTDTYSVMIDGGAVRDGQEGNGKQHLIAR